MNWKKLGLIWNTDGSQSWSKSHAMGPTPFLLNEDVIRIYLTTLDCEGRGRPMYIDVSAHNPTKVLKVANQPALDIGLPGAFDDNGLMVLSLIQPQPGVLWMYYAGFEICTQIRYRILSGLAISTNNGESFQRYSKAPILERTNQELYFRGGPFVILDNSIFKLWYVAGSNWLNLDGKLMPVYDLRYQESKDGIYWSSQGTLSMAVTGDDEYGFGRPWIVKHTSNYYQLFYSIRRRSFGAYRLGYAESTDGIHWVRKDQEMGLDVSPGQFDSEAIMYSAVISVNGRTYCFYNGNDFGKDGFAVAELLE